MEDNKQMTEFGTALEEEVQMRKVAPMRVAFRIHLTIFIIVNLIMWALWFTLFSAIVTDEAISSAILKVFVSVTVVWFLVVILHALIAFVWNKTLIEKELTRMRKQHAKQQKELQKLKEKIQKSKNESTSTNNKN